MATIKDVAQAAQVSAAAVSRVLNKDDNISVTPEVRARIFQAAHALGYVSPRQRKAAEHKTHLVIGVADWQIIRQVKEAVSIPVIGNGDVTTPEKAEELVQTTGCDGIMIARGAKGNPWIFSEMIGKEKNGVTPPRPDKEAIRNMILRHSKLQIQYRGEFAGMREMRKHVAWYTKGLTGAADLRLRVNETETLDELMMLLEEL